MPIIRQSPRASPTIRVTARPTPTCGSVAPPAIRTAFSAGTQPARKLLRACFEGRKPSPMATDSPSGIELDSERRGRAGLNDGVPRAKRTALSKEYTGQTTRHPPVSTSIDLCRVALLRFPPGRKPCSAVRFRVNCGVVKLIELLKRNEEKTLSTSETSRLPTAFSEP